jgi:hypothetical protein
MTYMVAGESAGGDDEREGVCVTGTSPHKPVIRDPQMCQCSQHAREVVLPEELRRDGRVVELRVEEQTGLRWRRDGFKSRGVLTRPETRTDPLFLKWI